MTTLTTGLLAFYKLSDLTDAAGGGFTLTNLNTVTFGTGLIGNCSIHTRSSLSPVCLIILNDF